MSESEKRWLRAARCDEIPRREGRALEIAGRKIAIFNLPEGFLAVANACPHRGGPLADGLVSGTVVVCPLHAKKIDLVSGQMIGEPAACVQTFPVEVHDGIVCVEMPPRTGAADHPGPACEHRDRPLRWVQRKLPAAVRDAAAMPGG
jgi:nitrite reductase (NADH) small subunit